MQPQDPEALVPVPACVCSVVLWEPPQASGMGKLRQREPKRCPASLGGVAEACCSRVMCGRAGKG